MTYPRALGLLALTGVAVFAAGVWHIETAARAEVRTRLEQHARAVAPAVWHLDPRLAQDYVRLAADASDYESIEVRTTGGALFLGGPAQRWSTADAVFGHLGLLPRTRLVAPIEHEGRTIGTLTAVWVSRTVFAEGYLLLALALFMVLGERSLRVVEGKRLLERRVADRTRELAESEARHRQLTRLLDLSHDIVFVRDSRRGISYWNEAAARFSGNSQAGEIADRLNAFYDAALTEAPAQALVTYGTWAGECDWTGADGTVRRFHASVSLALGGATEAPRVLFIATDITARKELELHLLRSQRAQAVGTLAAGVAHDFNNLLTPVLLSAQMLKTLPQLTPTQRSSLGTVEQCARRGAELVRQLLNLSGHRATQRTAVPLPGLLADLAQLIRGTFPKAIELSTDWPADLPAIEADATSLHQALLNLCVNARDAMPDGGRLAISCRIRPLDSARLGRHPEAVPGPWACLAIADSGTGIPEEMHEKIFDPFFTTKEAGRGTGLGLATVQGIARSHGGFVELESAPAQGSTFTLWLPAVLADASAREAAPPPLPGRPGRGELVLLVDDEPAVLEATTPILESAGYRVLGATSGQQALDLVLVRRGELRAVLTDLMMPGMDGLALRRALHTLAPGMPVGVMTGLFNQENHDRIKAAGFDATLLKPFRAEDAVRCVLRLTLTQRAATPPS